MKQSAVDSMQRLVWIFWPSFLVGGVAEVLFFTLIDPRELYLFGDPVHFSPGVTYTIGFFCFWAITACSSLFTCFIQRTASEVNRCPLAQKGCGKS